ncbi:SKP1-like protein 1B [Ananas comosus]|uniref:SKP1-like protein n=1 Tax=Ananas comosus TaxID=4615 RepID=A0A6P5FH80_ANACO|nr:SKP1-like protein 1B [Ananas comosus]
MESKVTRMIKIRSCDGAVLDVPEEVAVQSRLIRHAVEDFVTAETLNLAFEYCTKHADFAAAAAIPAADDEKKKAAETEIKDWTSSFVNALSMDVLYDLVHGSNYLAIEELMDLCCERVAGMIRRKSAEEVRATFDIMNDFPPNGED